MQGINISKVMAEPYEDIPEFMVFFFDGTMPNTLAEIPFDYTNANDLLANCTAYKTNYGHVGTTRLGSISDVGVNSFPKVFDRSPQTYGTEEANVIDVPARHIQGFTSTGLLGEPLPNLALTELSTAASFSEIEVADSVRNRTNATHYSRAGRENSFVIMDLGADPLQEYTARLYYYISTTDDDLFIDDTVFPHHLSKLQAAEPGVYDNTFTFIIETQEYDDHNQVVRTRGYDVDLLAGGTQRVNIQVVVDNSYATGTGTPPVSPELNTDTTLGFYEHDIPTQDIPLLIHGYTLSQRTIFSRQKRPSWSGSGSYNTRCTSARIDVWNPELNEGAGGWEIGFTFGVNATNIASEFGTPFSARRYIRLVCINGPVLDGYVVSSGDPHWSFLYQSLQTKASAIKYAPTEPTVTHTWALIVPFTDTFNRGSLNLNGTRTYGTETDLAPIVMCDVGGIGSGAGIEVEHQTYIEKLPPKMMKLNFKFDSGTPVV